MDPRDVTYLALIASILVLVVEVVRVGRAAGGAHVPGPGRFEAGRSHRDHHRRPASGRPPVFCAVCEVEMGVACARCGGPACATCDHCFGCRLLVCFSCDLEPTPPFWLPGDGAPHPHNGVLD